MTVKPKEQIIDANSTMQVTPLQVSYLISCIMNISQEYAYKRTQKSLDQKYPPIRLVQGKLKLILPNDKNTINT